MSPPKGVRFSEKKLQLTVMKFDRSNKFDLCLKRLKVFSLERVWDFLMDFSTNGTHNILKCDQKSQNKGQQHNSQIFIN